MLKIKFIIILFGVYLFVGCGQANKYFTESMAVPDVTKELIIRLEKKSGNNNVVSIFIEGKGNINGKAEISLLLNGKAYKTEKINDRFSFVWSGDWYSDTAEIIYKPNSVSSGSIKLNYSFGVL